MDANISSMITQTIKMAHGLGDGQEEATKDKLHRDIALVALTSGATFIQREVLRVLRRELAIINEEKGEGEVAEEEKALLNKLIFRVMGLTWTESMRNLNGPDRQPSESAGKQGG